MNQSDKSLDVLINELNALRSALDSLPYTIDIKDGRGRYIFSNAKHRKLLGVSSIDEVLGKTPYDFFPKEVARQYFDSDMEAMKSEGGYFHEEEHTIEEGKDEWYTKFKFPIRNENNENTAVIVGELNVTEQVLMRRQMEHEREMLHVLMDNIPDTIYFKDGYGRFTFINKAQAQLLGVGQPHEAIGKSDFDFFDNITAQETYADEQRIMHTGRPMTGKVEELKFFDGSKRWVSATKAPLRGANGKVAGIVGVTRDIHDRKIIEDRLAQEQYHLRTLIDNMPDFIYIKDRQSRFLISNQAHMRELGVKNNEGVVNKTDFDFFSAEYAQKYYDDEQSIMASGKPMVDMEEAEVSTTEGISRWLSTTKVPVRDSRGKIIGIVGISRDITERKRIEAALRRAKDELEVRVQERTADLQKANENLELRLSQLNFLTKASYELARYIDIDKLFPAILSTFLSRFPLAEGSLCRRTESGFSCVHATPALSCEKIKAQCAKTTEYLLKMDVQTPIMIEDWTKDKWLKKCAPPDLKNLRCYIAIPLVADNKVISCIQIFTTHESVKIYERDKLLLTTLSAHAAVCHTNANYYRELREQARVEGELQAARNIQRSYTPQHAPPIPHVNVKGVYYPAFEVSGDYLDYFQTENGDWVVVIADVCGKGVPAALHMTVLRSTFRCESRNCKSAKEILCAVNKTMKSHLDNKSFVTALCLFINKDGTLMKYSRAGHPLLLRLDQNCTGPVNIPCSGIAIGLVPETETFNSLLHEVDIPLKKGERFLVYTDGLTEAFNVRRESYGFERLCRVLQKERSHNPEKIISKIMDDVKNFTVEAPYHDDLTMLAINVN